MKVHTRLHTNEVISFVILLPNIHFGAIQIVSTVHTLFKKDEGRVHIFEFFRIQSPTKQGEVVRKVSVYAYYVM